MPFIGQIKLFAGNFAPAGWVFCDGALLSIAENEALFTLLGTTYGGDGESNFGVPDLRGRVPVHQGTGPEGTNYVIGQSGGTETVSLTLEQIPAHNHQIQGSTLAGFGANPGNSPSPAGRYPAIKPGTNLYSTDLKPDTYMSDFTLAENLLDNTGGEQPHNNMQAYLPVQYIISLFGTYPQAT